MNGQEILARGLFEGPVDIVSRDSLKPYVRPPATTDAIYAFYTSKGYSLSQDTFRKAMATVNVEPGFPGDLAPYMQEQAEILLKEKKIAAIPDWSKALRPDFMEKARASS